LRKIHPNLRRKPAVRERLLEKIVDLARVPQGFVRWMPYAIIEGLRLIRNQGVDIVHSMNNPITNHLIGYVLHKLTGRPWLAEFRDPWVAYLYNARGPDFIDRLLEKEIVSNATSVVWYSTLQMADDYFLKAYPAQPADKFHQIPYFGYDSIEFEEIWRTKIGDLSKETLRISYVGSFYEGGITPEYFLKGLAEFLRERTLNKNQLLVTFAGSWNERYSQLVEYYGLEDFVEYIGYVSRSRCLEVYRDSHILLLIGAPGGMDFPSKFWDYLGARRVMLALVPPESRVASCIIQEKLGVVAQPVNIDAISRSIASLHASFIERKLDIRPSKGFLESASRYASEREFADALHDALGGV